MSNWIVKEPKKFEPLPIGAYYGPFKGVEECVINDSPKWRFAFEVAKGEHAGKIESTLTDRDISPNKLAGQLIAGLLGRPLVPGEDVEQAVRACVGTQYLFVVSPGPKGGKPAVRTVTKPPAA